MWNEIQRTQCRKHNRCVLKISVLLWLTLYFQNQFNPLHKSLLLLESKVLLRSFPLFCTWLFRTSPFLLSVVTWCGDVISCIRLLIQLNTSPASTSCIAFLLTWRRGVKWVCLMYWEGWTLLLPMVVWPLPGSTVCSLICIWKGRQRHKRSRTGI